MCALLTAASPRFNLALSNRRMPNDDKITLFPHQQAMLYKMITIENNRGHGRCVGILSDEPGSGKSYCLLALILHEKRTFKKTQNLFVIPHNIYAQWKEYIRHVPELTVRDFIQYSDTLLIYYQPDILSEYDIVLTTVTYYQTIASTLTSLGLRMNRVIIDEVDSVDWFTQIKIPCDFVWLVSATAKLTKDGAFKDLINNPYTTVQCTSQFIASSIQLPPPVYKVYLCANSELGLLNIHFLGNDSEPKQQSAVHALDFNSFAFKHVSSSGINSTRQLLHALNRDALLRLDHLEIQIAETINRIRQGRGNADVEQELYGWHSEYNTLKAKMCLIAERVQTQECPVCLEEYSPYSESNADRCKTVVKCCQNVFCMYCIKQCLFRNATCGICRQPLTEEDIVVVDQQQLETGHKKEPAALPPPPPQQSEGQPDETRLPDGSMLVDYSSGLRYDKMQVFDTILQKNRHRQHEWRLLVFSDFLGSFKSIRTILTQRGHRFAEIEGTMDLMEKTIAAFRDGTVPILLVDSQHYGAGLNLECTTDIVLLHRTERKSQIVGRAQRLGRRGTLMVHELVYDDE